MESNTSLEELIIKEGEVFNNTDIVVDTKKVIDMVDQKYQNSYVYGEVGPMPGVPVDINTDNILKANTEKKEANKKLLASAALLKLKKEQEEFNKKSDEEKIKTYVLNSIMQQQEKNFLDKYHYVMSGQQKRNTRKIIERNYSKGKYKLTPKQKDDILYQINLSSATKKENNNTNINKPSTSSQLQSLML